jgi:DNA polymerase-4/DNA polymerase V
MCYSGPGYKALLHIDADSFFASCEQAVDTRLKGKPVVTGKERGICSAASYEAKALGVKRGMPLHEIKRVCPECIIVPSNYETYSIFSTRMFEIVRRYTDEVEEYGIDECFASITGLRRALKKTYVQIARAIKDDIEGELNIGASIGLAPTKVLAKIGSKWDKPSGLVVINSRMVPDFLRDMPTEDVWGIGMQTANFLKSRGVVTALEFIQKDERWVERNLSKPYIQIWHELRCTSVLPIETKKKQEYKSISKTKTFTPPSDNRSFVLAQLSKNIENACIKARRYNLTTNEVRCFLKTQDFRYHGIVCTLRQRVSVPEEIVRVVVERFDEMYTPETLYRASGVTLCNLGGGGVQQDLFGAHAEVEKLRKIHESADTLNARYGKHSVFLGSSFQAMTHSAHAGARGELPERNKQRMRGETARKRLGIPITGEVI